MENSEQLNVPRCPTCQSTKIEKISKKSKVGSAVLWGVFALGKVSKTFKCKNCGYSW
jgi:predicted Zn-ribbon and HTH transcriptional regulator